MTGGGADLLRWCTAAAVDLVDAGVLAGRLAAAIAADWLDDNGREWAERAGRLGRELDAAAADAAHVARELARPDREPDPALIAAHGIALRGGSGRGPRLGGTDGDRAGDDRGVHLPQLPDDEPG